MVSSPRSAFYVHFAGKEDCFLAATREGGWLMINQVAEAARRVPAGAGAEEALRAGIAAFLEFLAREPAFARAFYVDMPAAGPRAVARIEAGLHNFARLNRAWHERARRDHPEWPVVPYQAYYALAGATAQLVRAQVSQGTIDSVPELEDTLVALHLAVLAARPMDEGPGLRAGRTGPGRPGTASPSPGGTARAGPEGG